ncbi:lactonase family protein [Terrimonas alba]|uniref:lactonase family protein n=1 Tax=Terrimonas alba TaxID=3349636 RepID=UPI0035F4964A
MKQIKRLIGATLIFSLLFAACRKDGRLVPETNNLSEETESDATAVLGSNGKKHENGPGYVYTLSNQADGNKALMYRRAVNGQLSFLSSFFAGGNGTGGGLGNQGAVALTKDGKIVLAVNAGSNTLSSLKVTGNGLNLKSTVSSGGMQPVSVTVHDDLVFVLNAGGNGNISGFKLLNNGKLHPIANSTRPLSVAAPTGPAQISFVRGGKVLVITEKATNTITTYTVNDWGIPGDIHTKISSSPTPFGFATGKGGLIFVSEAVGGTPGASVLSSYRIRPTGEISLVDGSVGAGQSAACWVVLTNDGIYAYTTNTGSNNLTSFDVNPFSGDIDLRDAIAATTPAGPIDAALTTNSKFLYVLNAGGHSISAFTVSATSSLGPIQTVPGLPAGATGLAAN